ncbi:MAG: bifunctional phosphoglucose/phosphomannose isomerase [Anaerolineae bacterium]|nr:bifunctional phosphoglucose/phosphomannose isomerase [Anaerolineae bacterium]
MDDLTQYDNLDVGKMHQLIADLPRQCRSAWLQAQDLSLPASYRDVRRVVVLGMGGSAIGGALLAGLVHGRCPLPILSVAGYALPAYADSDSLVIASSYSGNTEETLAALAQAKEQGCRLLAVTTGGQLAVQAEKDGFPLLRFHYSSPPRAALGYSFTLLLGVLQQMGFLRDDDANVEEAAAVMEAWQHDLAPAAAQPDNPAKQLAVRLRGRLPVVYGAGFLSAVARRWKGQFNENAKQWAFWEEMPELNHNAVVGYGQPGPVRGRVTVLCLRSPLDHPRIQARWAATQELLEREKVTTETVWGRGTRPLAQMLSLIHFGDYVSFYLALLNGVDPTPVEAIRWLKQRVAEKQL